MPRRNRFLGVSLSSLVMFLVLGLGFCAIGSAAVKDQVPEKDDVEMICHTENPEDCYPKIFQATEEFQIVREDQDIPRGLHVRMDMETGQKEAKINDPNEVNPALEGLPVEQDILVVDPEQVPVTEPVIPSDAPAYDPAGVVKQPSDESSSFYDNIKTVKNGPSWNWLRSGTFDDALEGLEDLSHDIYYGLKITEDVDVVKALLCHMTSSKVFDAHADELHAQRATQAAKILGAALQNNPTALKEVEQEWDSIATETCPGGQQIGKAIFSTIRPATTGNGEEGWHDQSLALTKAKLTAINGLIKSSAIRNDFLLKSPATRQILDVLLLAPAEPSTKGWLESLKKKAANFILDNFLDGDMGATLGVWPYKPAYSTTICDKEQGQPSDECWSFHLERLATQNNKDAEHWSQELWSKFQSAELGNGQPEQGTARKNDEL